MSRKACFTLLDGRAAKRASSLLKYLMGVNTSVVRCRASLARSHLAAFVPSSPSQPARRRPSATPPASAPAPRSSPHPRSAPPPTSSPGSVLPPNPSSPSSPTKPWSAWSPRASTATCRRGVSGGDDGGQRVPAVLRGADDRHRQGAAPCTTFPPLPRSRPSRAAPSPSLISSPLAGPPTKVL